MMATDWFTRKEVSTWSELYDCLKDYMEETEKQWAFRGHSKECWGLETGIERLRRRFDVEWGDLPEYECKVLREFRRRAHIYHPNLPKLDDHLEWLALLRHHGGPTRLLDITYSPFIASYFALEEANADAAVWAIKKVWLREEARTIVKREISDGERLFADFVSKRDGESFKGIFWRCPPVSFISSAVPMRLNERLSLQQGAFLCPGNLTVSFEANLKAIRNGLKDNVHKIVIKRDYQADLLERLRRMNVDSTTLFPSLDGFARSLNARFVELGKYPVAG